MLVFILKEVLVLLLGHCAPIARLRVKMGLTIDRRQLMFKLLCSFKFKLFFVEDLRQISLKPPYFSLVIILH